MSSNDSCPVCRTADIVCGKWTLLLIRDLADGRSRFCELERSLAGISPRTLSLRLRAHHFFATTAFNARMSTACSATMCFS